MMSKELVEIICVCWVITAITTKAQLNESCTTPNGESAKCIPIQSCQVILDAVQTKNESAIKFAQDSQCGYDKVPLVCCGSTGYVDSGLGFLFSVFEESAETSTVPEITKEDETLIELNSKELPDRSVCGIHSGEDRIYGGEKTEIDEYPWMAALEFKNRKTGQVEGVKCGGSVISKRFVLTAAHCLTNREFEIVHVRLGEWKLTSDPDCDKCEPVQKVKVEQIIRHPYYGSLNKNNDIALLRLEKNITFTDFIRPVCLPPENLRPPEEGTDLTVAGWGLTEHGNAASDVKLKVNVPTISNAKCKEALKNSVKIQANQVCAGGVRGKDACQGDSGGPLVRSFVDKVHGRTQWYQEGIVSHGVKCGLEGFPGIYTRISRYITWILHNIEPE